MKNIFLIVFLGIVSFLLCAELFFFQAPPQTFDGWTHLASIKQFHTAISQGSFPVSWVQGVANYGLPLGQIAHQIPIYLGALFLFATGNLFTAYALLAWTGAFLSCLTLYWFLRRHFSDVSAGIAAAFFCLAPYRIANLYIRGAVPEFWASVFIPIIMAGVHDVMVKQGNRYSWLFITIGTAGLALTHPMMLVISSVVIGPYAGACWLHTHQGKLKKTIITVLAGGSGLALAAYYLLPLFLEMKYFYYSQLKHGGPDSPFPFLSLANYFTEQWQFTYLPGNGIRMPTLQLGIVEMGVVVISVLVCAWLLIKPTVSKHEAACINTLWAARGWFLSFGIGMMLTLPVSTWLFQNVSLLSGTQHPWRMLTALSFIPALLAAWLIELQENQNTKKWLGVGLLLAVFLLRFPQLYGKNHVAFAQSRYDFSLVNPHSTNMNPVWTSVSWDYPIKNTVLDVVEGNGIITPLSLKPTQRLFEVDAATPLRLSTNTFYFPGWEASVTRDGQKEPLSIEYQDPDYRGVMTTRLPQGKQQVLFEFTDTKIRLLGKVITVVTLLGCIGVVVATKKIAAKTPASAK